MKKIIVIEGIRELNIEIKGYEKSMRRDELAPNTIVAYTNGVRQYFERYNSVTLDNVLAYKMYLTENYSIESVNQKIGALNRYFRYKNIYDTYKLKKLRIQQKPFLENVISLQDYDYLKKRLRKDNEYVWYYLIWGIGCTGARISEILQVKYENLEKGYMDFYGKGRKQRRIYFPTRFKNSCLQWLHSIKRTSGHIYINAIGNIITPNLALKYCKRFANDYGIEPSVMYPHSFRHLFGREFYIKSNGNLLLLSDLMGHSSVDTTRIYARMSALEQTKIINDVVKW